VTVGTAAPFGSVTRPSMFPVVACDWGNAAIAANNRQVIKAKHLEKEVNFLIMCSFRGVHFEIPASKLVVSDL